MGQDVEDFTSCFDENDCDETCSDALASASATANTALAANDTVKSKPMGAIDTCDAVQSQFRYVRLVSLAVLVDDGAFWFKSSHPFFAETLFAPLLAVVLLAKPRCKALQTPW